MILFILHVVCEDGRCCNGNATTWFLGIWILIHPDQYFEYDVLPEDVRDLGPEMVYSDLIFIFDQKPSLLNSGARSAAS